MATNKLLLSLLIGACICVPLYTAFEVYGSDRSLAEVVLNVAVYTTISLAGLALTLRYMARKSEA